MITIGMIAMWACAWHDAAGIWPRFVSTAHVASPHIGAATSMSSEGGIGEGAMASEGAPDDWGHHDGVLMTSAPLRDMIRLVREPFSGRSLLAHTGLKEELLLDPPSGAWLLGYMDDGEPFLCDDGSDEEHLCKDLFPRELLVSDSGRFAAAKTHSDGEVEIEWLCVLEQRFKYMELDMHIGPL